MSMHARAAKQQLRAIRCEARKFYAPWWENPAVVPIHDKANQEAANASIPPGYEPISHKRRVCFRLPKANELFVVGEGFVTRAAWPHDVMDFGCGPRWIVRKKRN